MQEPKDLPPSQAWLKPNFQEQSISCCSENLTASPATYLGLSPDAKHTRPEADMVYIMKIMEAVLTCTMSTWKDSLGIC